MGGFTHSIAGGDGNLVIGSFQSPNFVAGVSGWQVTIEGDAEFNQVFVRGEFFGNTFQLDDAGVFFYTATPAAGNLLATIASAAGSDQFLNAYQAGLNLYGAHGSIAALVIDPSTANPALWFVPPSAAHLTIHPQQFVGILNPGAVNELYLLVETSGKAGGQADAAAQYFSASADGTSTARIVWEFGGTVGATLTAAGFVPNAWTAASSFGSGWAASGSGASGFFFRKRLDGVTVDWMADVHTTSATPSTTICTIPAAYVPASGLVSLGLVAGTAAYGVAMQTSGAAQASTAVASGTRFSGSGFYTLVAP